jgi:hypothetical protein
MPVILIKAKAIGLIVVCVMSIANVGELRGETVQQSSQPVSERFQTNFDERHDRGMMLRLEAGAGFVSRWSSDLGTDGEVAAQGIGALLSLAVGWLPVEQVAVHLSTWGVVGRGAQALAAGPGATYWFAPEGPWFVSACAGIMTLDRGGELFDQFALAGELEGGLFGWVGDHAEMGASIIVAAEGLDIDSDGIQQLGWRTGVRVGIGFD